MKAETLAYVGLWAILGFMIGVSVYRHDWGSLSMYVSGYALGRYWRYLNERNE